MNTYLAEVSSHWPIHLGYFVHLESKYRLNDNISQCCADANGFPSFGGFVRCAAEAGISGIILDAGGTKRLYNIYLTISGTEHTTISSTTTIIIITTTSTTTTSMFGTGSKTVLSQLAMEQRKLEAHFNC